MENCLHSSHVTHAYTATTVQIDHAERQTAAEYSFSMYGYILKCEQDY